MSELMIPPVVDVSVNHDADDVLGIKHSKFWLPKWFTSGDLARNELLLNDKTLLNDNDLLALKLHQSVKSAVSNFVRIISNGRIHTNYKSENFKSTVQSMIRSTIELPVTVYGGKIDVHVGMALQICASEMYGTDAMTNSQFIEKFTGTAYQSHPSNINRANLRNLLTYLCQYVEYVRTYEMFKYDVAGYSVYLDSLRDHVLSVDAHDRSYNEISNDPSLQNHVHYFMFNDTPNFVKGVTDRIREAADMFNKRIYMLQNVADSCDLAHDIMNIFYRPQSGDSFDVLCESTNFVDMGPILAPRQLFNYQSSVDNSKDLIETLQAAENVSITTLDVEYSDYSNIPVTVIRNISPDVLQTSFAQQCSLNANTQISKTECNTAKRIGHKVAEKLIVRNQVRMTEVPRRMSGTIDKRRLHSAAFSEDIFKTLRLESYNNAFIHLSIDASGSMSGTRIKSALMTSVALVTAFSKLKGTQIQVSLRASGKTGLPVLVVLYDSKYNQLSDFYTLIRHVAVNNSTPESLCYKSIESVMTDDERHTSHDLYFLNLTDGEPGATMRIIGTTILYTGEPAYKHVRSMLKSFERNNVQHHTYFVGRTNGSMQDAFVNIDQINESDIAKTLIKSINKILMKGSWN